MSIRTNNMNLRKNGFLWVATLTVVVLLIPLILMQFTDEVNWAIGDFVVMGCILSGMGSLLVLVSRRVHQNYKVAVASLIVASAVYLWAELAVGIFSDLGS